MGLSEILGALALVAGLAGIGRVLHSLGRIDAKLVYLEPRLADHSGRIDENTLGVARLEKLPDMVLKLDEKIDKVANKVGRVHEDVIRLTISAALDETSTGGRCVGPG